VKLRAALALVVAGASLACAARAATAYVTDQLVLNVYSGQNQQGERLATLHSGASVDTLASSGDFTQVRLADGTTGWVKSSYLTTQEPATVRVKQLEEELDRAHSTSPGLAEAAARSAEAAARAQVQRLQEELAAKQAQLDLAAHAGPPSARPSLIGAGLACCAALAAAALGFWLGYVTLARRVRRKFGGLRVY